MSFALVVGAFLAGGLLCILVEHTIRYSARLGKTQILYTDWDSGRLFISFVKTTGNEFARTVGGEKRRYILDGHARLQGQYGPAYIIHPRHGWNLVGKQDTPIIQTSGQAEGNGSSLASRVKADVVAFHPLQYAPPSDAQTVQAHPALRLLALSNPASYQYAIEHNEARDSLEANDTADHWIVKVAPWAMGAIMLSLIVILYIAWKIAGSSSAAGVA